MGTEQANPFERIRSRWLIPSVAGTAIAVLLLVTLATGVVSIATGGEFGDNPATGGILAFLAGYVGMVTWILWVCRRAGVDIRRLIGKVPAGHDWAITGALLAVTITFSYGSWELVAWVLSRVSPDLLIWLLQMVPERPDGTLAHDMAMVFIVVALAPVVEEVLFRGVLVSRWSVKWGATTGILVSAVAFGILHANVIGIGFVGLVTAVLYFQTRTLIVPIVFHAANNAIGTVGMYLPGGSDTTALMEGDGWLGFLLVFVTLPVLIWYLWRFWPARDATIPYMGGAADDDEGERDGNGLEDPAVRAGDNSDAHDPDAEGSR